ncbi:hypothetical protein AAVH_14050 [Aphelenchoides avenae]|nr:hypothetical protein AAVH_14050 [Aphelenchus avenae]
MVYKDCHLALFPVESLTLSNEDDSNDDDSNDDDSEDDGDLTAWKFSVQYAEQIDYAPDDDVEIEEEECDEEKFDQAEDFEFEADFDECFLRFILVLRICSIDCCVIDASCGKASLSSAQFKSFIDATKSSNVAVMRLYDISLRQLTADEFFGLTRVPGLCDLLVQHCSLRSAFVDATFIRVCGECGITTLTVSPGPVDGSNYATDDESLLEFCFKRRAGTSPPIKLDVHLSHPTISADFVASFKQVSLFSGKQRQQSSSSAHSCNST